MDVRILPLIWVLLPLFLKVIEPTLCVSLRLDDNKIRSTEENDHVNDPVKNRRRASRQTDTEAITSVKPIAVTTNTPTDQTNSSEKYSPVEIENTTNTIIPLSATEAYGSSSSDLKENKETMTIQSVTTDKPYRIENKDAESSPDVSQVTEAMRDSIQPLASSDKNGNLETSDQLAVVGFSEKSKHTERIMRLEPSKEEKYAWLKETIHNMLEHTILKNETEDYVSQLHRKYDDLPVEESDNSIWTKYSRAIVENFVLNFCRNYPRYIKMDQSNHKYKEEQYTRIYNTTLLNLKQKKGDSAVQFAAPVRRAADIYKAILDTPIAIVMSKCETGMQQWMCFAEYVVRLADISKTCEYIWYHAQVHLSVLEAIRKAKGAKDAAEEVINELDSRLKLTEPNNDVNYLFDFIIQTLDDLRERLKEPLLLYVRIYNLIRELQSEDKLKCLNIDAQGF